MEAIGWLPYRVICNQRWLVASFWTERERDAFIAARSAKYPANAYSAYSAD